MVVVKTPSEGKPSMGKSVTELSSNTRVEPTMTVEHTRREPLFRFYALLDCFEHEIAGA